jgi:NAD(P)-dependent dehydrogenase (short-subunit alcohol dehydrogenase family)
VSRQRVRQNFPRKRYRPSLWRWCAFDWGQRRIQLDIAVNHLAPFLLTNLLLDRLKDSAPARIVTVASEAHRRNRLDIADMTRPADWTMMRAYGRSKLCNILFTRELASRLDAGEVVAASLHPGMVATAIGQRGGLVELGWRVLKLFMISPERGAETPVFLATVPDPEPFHGGYLIRKALPRRTRRRSTAVWLAVCGTRAHGWSASE